MSQRLWPGLTIILLLLIVHMALAATATAVLAVEGMT